MHSGGALAHTRFEKVSRRFRVHVGPSRQREFVTFEAGASFVWPLCHVPLFNHPRADDDRTTPK